MNIVVKSIPTKDHRYATLGDYWTDPDGTLQFRVSSEFSQKAQVLLLLHEMAEAFLCQNDGISFLSIDEFDKAFERRLDEPPESEPGDDPACPYRVQHRRAENIERLMADFMRVEWPRYVAEFDEIVKALDALSRSGHFDK
jgi:hypothetical protein